MRAQLVRVTALLAAALVSSVVYADEVVEFRDGRYLEIKSHEVLEQAMRLNVAGNSYLVIPLVLVDRIEQDGREVFRHPDLEPARAIGSDPSMVLMSALRGDAGHRGVVANRMLRSSDRD